MSSSKPLDPTVNQLKELKDAFDLFDKDKSGVISSSELRQVLSALDIDGIDDEFESLMTSMDRNNSGTIEFVEFAKVMGSRFYAPKSKNDIISAFRSFDKDNNGTISGEELQKLMRNFRGNMTREECRELIAKVDKDGSGTISIAEFIDMLE